MPYGEGRSTSLGSWTCGRHWSDPKKRTLDGEQGELGVIAWKRHLVTCASRASELAAIASLGNQPISHLYGVCGTVRRRQKHICSHRAIGHLLLCYCCTRSLKLLRIDTGLVRPSIDLVRPRTLIVNMPLDKTIYQGTFIHCKALTEIEIWHDSTIAVGEDGRIAFIDRAPEGQPTPTREGWENAKVIRLQGNQFFFPGFIGMRHKWHKLDASSTNAIPDTHIHASQYPNAGVFGKSTLLDWLNTYTFPLESSFSHLPTASKIYNRVVARTLSHGTTTACYYATVHVPATNLLADICQFRGQRAFVGRVCMDRMSPEYYRDESVDSALSDSKACIEHVKQIDPGYELITPVLTPRFAPSCTDEVLAALGRLQKATDLPVQTHISENKAEIALVAELFPKSKHYTDVYDTAGLLTPKTILAHAVHLSQEERQLIRQRDAKLSHCPASNTAITSGRAKVRELLDAGITMGLGTDVSGGYTPSILAQCREAIFVSRHIAMDTDRDADKLSPEEALYLATRGGAKVVGLEERIGGFEVGMDWDAQVVSLGGTVEGKEDVALGQGEGLVEIFGNESWEDRVAKWVYTGDDRNTLAVWVKGRLVHDRPGWKACSKEF